MYVYWWHVRGLDAVKVGHAEDPRQQVSDLRRELGLGGKVVRGYRLDRGTDAEWVASQLSRTLESAGLPRVFLESELGEEEFFTLEGRSFDEMHELLRSASRHIAFAEVSNRRKQQRRRELEAAREAYPEEPRWTSPVHPPEELTPERPHLPQSSPFRLAVPLGCMLIAALVVWGLLADVMEVVGDRLAAGAPEQTERPVSIAQAGNTPPSLHSTQPQSSEGGGAASSVSAEPLQKVGPPLEPKAVVPQQQTSVSTQSGTQQVESTTPVASPPPLAAVPPPAARPSAQSQASGEPQAARVSCRVSRPQPGFQVYRVTCPDSRVTIGRTVDSPSGWTVSESVNGTEAIEFFMRSRHAR